MHPTLSLMRLIHGTAMMKLSSTMESLIQMALLRTSVGTCIHRRRIHLHRVVSTGHANFHRSPALVSMTLGSMARICMRSITTCSNSCLAPSMPRRSLTASLTTSSHLKSLAKSLEACSQPLRIRNSRSRSSRLPSTHWSQPTPALLLQLCTQPTVWAATIQTGRYI